MYNITMRDLTAEDIECLTKVGEGYSCELCLPPFNGTNHVFYNTSMFSQVSSLNLWLINAGYSFKSTSVDDKQYIEIIGGYDG